MTKLTVRTGQPINAIYRSQYSHWGHDYHGHLAGTGSHVVAPRCPRQTVHFQRSSVGWLKLSQLIQPLILRGSVTCAISRSTECGVREHCLQICPHQAEPHDQREKCTSRIKDKTVQAGWSCRIYPIIPVDSRAAAWSMMLGMHRPYIGH